MTQAFTQSLLIAVFLLFPLCWLPSPPIPSSSRPPQPHRSFLLYVSSYFLNFSLFTTIPCGPLLVHPFPSTSIPFVYLLFPVYPFPIPLTFPLPIRPPKPSPVCWDISLFYRFPFPFISSLKNAAINQPPLMHPLWKRTINDWWTLCFIFLRCVISTRRASFLLETKTAKQQPPQTHNGFLTILTLCLLTICPLLWSPHWPQTNLTHPAVKDATLHHPHHHHHHHHDPLIDCCLCDVVATWLSNSIDTSEGKVNLPLYLAEQLSTLECPDDIRIGENDLPGKSNFCLWHHKFETRNPHFCCQFWQHYEGAGQIPKVLRETVSLLEGAIYTHR